MDMLLASTSESAVEVLEGLDLVRHSTPKQTVCCLFYEHRGELLVGKRKLRNQCEWVAVVKCSDKGHLSRSLAVLRGSLTLIGLI
jgi:hypothetical protein